MGIEIRHVEWLLPALAMRASGMTISHISMIVHRDRQSVRQQLLRHGINPQGPLLPQGPRGLYEKKVFKESGYKRVSPVRTSFPIGKYDHLLDDLDTPSYWN